MADSLIKIDTCVTFKDDDDGEELGTTKGSAPRSYPFFLFPTILSRRVFQNCSLTRIVPAITRDPFSPLNHHHRPRILFAHLDADFDVVAAAGESTHSAPQNRIQHNFSYILVTESVLLEFTAVLRLTIIRLRAIDNRSICILELSSIISSFLIFSSNANNFLSS